MRVGKRGKREALDALSSLQGVNAELNGKLTEVEGVRDEIQGLVSGLEEKRNELKAIVGFCSLERRYGPRVSRE